MFNVEKDSFKFLKFDHGAEENLKRYGVNYAPEWIIEDIITEVVLISCGNDRLANPLDVAALYERLPKDRTKLYTIEDWDHITSLYPRDPTPLFNVLDKELL